MRAPRRFVLFNKVKNAVVDTGVEFANGQVALETDGPLDMRDGLPPLLVDHVELVYLDPPELPSNQEIASALAVLTGVSGALAVA